MTFRLSKAAQHDLDECWLHIARDNEPAADRLVDTIYEKLILIAAHPELGRSCETLAAGIRRFPVGAYVIFYRKRDSSLEIVRILHDARDIERILGLG